MAKNTKKNEVDLTGIDVADEYLWVRAKEVAEALNIKDDWYYIFDLYYSYGGKERLLYFVHEGRPCRFLCSVNAGSTLLMYMDDRTLGHVATNEISAAPKQFKKRDKNTPTTTIDVPAHCICASDGTATYLRTLHNYKMNI